MEYFPSLLCIYNILIIFFKGFFGLLIIFFKDFNALTAIAILGAVALGAYKGVEAYKAQAIWKEKLKALLMILQAIHDCQIVFVKIQVEAKDFLNNLINENKIDGESYARLGKESLVIINKAWDELNFNLIINRLFLSKETILLIGEFQTAFNKSANPIMENFKTIEDIEKKYGNVSDGINPEVIQLLRNVINEYEYKIIIIGSFLINFIKTGQKELDLEIVDFPDASGTENK